MNERVMQFRIGMFVIVAGLVLTMLIVWFGESPSLFREHAFVKVRYSEAPGVSEGISVRKSGIRIGEVVKIDFDERPNLPDTVVVILSIERKYKLKKGAVARISRSLIGDVTIDMLPATTTEVLNLSDTEASAPEIAGDITPDPSKALTAATAAFERVGGTLTAIEEAATGLATLSKKASTVDQFLATWNETGKNMSSASQGIDRFIKTNEADFKPAIANLRQATEKLNAAFDPQTAANTKLTLERLASASAKLDASLTDLRPVLADLGLPAKSNAYPTTHLGQSMYWLNRISGNFNLLTNNLNDGKGNLNPNGSLQRLVTRPELFDNLSRMATNASEAFANARPALAAFRVFAEKIAANPSLLTRGALTRQ